jgi:hypothetical protein
VAGLTARPTPRTVQTEYYVGHKVAAKEERTVVEPEGQMVAVKKKRWW